MSQPHNFPRGKISADDEGSVQIAIAADRKRGVVVVQFANPVTWLAFEKDFAIKLAETILAKAKELSDA